jgi:two-component system, chemotaxis family, protein-glutamate methylesterase/glutaminase
MIRAFVVDDSAVVRQTLQALLQGDPEVVLAGAAPNPLIAAPLLRRQRPDVLVLDIEMPGMDGLTFLRQQMAELAIPTVICSSLSTEGSRVALDALAAGAVAVVAKPRLGLKQFLLDSRAELLAAIKLAARARPRSTAAPAQRAGPRPAVAASAPVAGLHALSVNKPVVIGSSTGGTQALEQILLALPADAPGIAVVQHMPERFTKLYADRLDGVCAMRVREARDGDRLERGLVLIAPGGRHLRLRKAAGQYHAEVIDGPPVNRHKPSVDVLFRSLAQHTGGDALAIMLTGMGDDGAQGMRQLHDLGVRTLAQDEASCVVFGMPKEAIRLGAVDEVLPLDAMAAAITRFDSRG